MSRDYTKQAKMHKKEVDGSKNVNKDILKKIYYGEMVYDKEKNIIFEYLYIK